MNAEMEKGRDFIRYNIIDDYVNAGWGEKLGDFSMRAHDGGAAYVHFEPKLNNEGKFTAVIMFNENNEPLRVVDIENDFYGNIQDALTEGLNLYFAD